MDRKALKQFMILFAYFVEKALIMEIDWDMRSTESKISFISSKELQPRINSSKIGRRSYKLFSSFSIDQLFERR